MKQVNLIVNTLKQELKRQNINYKTVAEALELSHASVRSLFSKKRFTLERLAKICELLQLEISDLVHEMEKQIELTERLSLAQERELTSDIKLLLMAHFLMNRVDFDEIIEIYDISKPEGIRLLTRLDKMKIIELLPGNRVRLMIAKNFSPIPGGPLQRFYEKKVQSEFLDTSFEGPGEHRVYVHGMFSRGANAELIRKIKRLANDAHELREESDPLPFDERFGCSLILAIRPWEVKLFTELRRKPNPKHF